MRFPRRHLFAIVVLAAVAGAHLASAAQAPEKEGVAVPKFIIVGYKFRIPRAYLDPEGPIEAEGLIFGDWRMLSLQ